MKKLLTLFVVLSLLIAPTVLAQGAPGGAGGGGTPPTPFTGEGTPNQITKFLDAKILGNSQITDDGTNVGIGTTFPSETLTVAGNVLASIFMGDGSGLYNVNADRLTDGIITDADVSDTANIASSKLASDVVTAGEGNAQLTNDADYSTRTELTTLETAFNDFVDTVNAWFASLQAQIDDLRTDVTALQADNAAQQTAIDANAADNAAQQTLIDALNSGIATLQDDVAGISAVNDNQDAQITDLNTLVSSQSGLIAALQEQVAAQQSQITDLQNQINAYHSGQPDNPCGGCPDGFFCNDAGECQEDAPQTCYEVPQLLAYWKADDATDSAGGTGLSLSESVSFTPGVEGEAFNFQQGSATTSNTFEGTRSVTFWVNPDHSGNQGFMGTDAGGYNNVDTMIGINDWNVCSAVADGHVLVETHDPEGITSCTASSAPLPVDKWTHIGVVADGENMNLYINGQLDSQRPYTGTLFGSTGFGLGFGSNYFRHMMGQLDEIKISNAPLQPDDIMADMQSIGCESASPPQQPTECPADQELDAYGNCIDARDCNDDDPCTTDTNTIDGCANTPIAGCLAGSPPAPLSVDRCGDGIDEDGDGIIDETCVYNTDGVQTIEYSSFANELTDGDGVYTGTFCLHHAIGAIALYCEDKDFQATGGEFSVTIGESNPIPEGLFPEGNTAYLSRSFNGGPQTTAEAILWVFESPPVTGSGELEFCGGLEGIPCAQGYACFDDPNDDCDPAAGGADCAGVCSVGDQDDDGILDELDNCPFDSSPDQTDTDGDGEGDICDGDDDGDGISDADDVCPLDPINACAGPTGPTSPTGPTGPTSPPDKDSDGVWDDSDNCVYTSNPDQTDNDDDGWGNACDPYPNDVDGDGDGTWDSVDNCVAISNADQADADNDGLGDVCDPYPNGDGPTSPNNDGDNVAVGDNCPGHFNPAQFDNDADGLGNECDPYPDNPDGDDDGVVDSEDNCWVDYNPDQADNDSDGLGNVCDSYPDGEPAGPTGPTSPTG